MSAHGPTIEIRIELYRAQFHGLRGDDSVDWPPSPLRLLGALIDGAHRLDEPERGAALAAVDRLAMTAPPLIDAPVHHSLDIPATYTERTGMSERPGTNELGQLLDLSHVAMSTKSRWPKPQDAVGLAGTVIRYLIDAPDWDDSVVADLDAAAAQVGYFGRSLDPAGLAVLRADEDDQAIPPADAGRLWVRWTPVYGGGPTRVWQTNSPQWYEINHRIVHEFIGRSPLAPYGYHRPMTYVADTGAAPAVTDGSGEPEETGPAPVAIVPLNSPISGHRVPRLLSGLPMDLRDHLFPCVAAWHDRSDGRCFGFGIAGPTAEERAAVARALRAALPPGQSDPASDRWTLQPDSWTASSRHWISATPLRAFGRIEMVQYLLTETFGTAVRLVAADVAPRRRWQTRWPTLDLVDGLDQWWVEFVTDEPVTGPLQLGPAADYGYGLFVPGPVTDRKDRS